MEPVNSETGPSPQGRLVQDDPPPFLRTWPHLYLAVVGYLFVLIVVLYLITKHLNRV
jgi:hypothetical protein